MRGGQGKRLLFCAREKWFSKSGGKTSQEGITAWENIYRQQTCRPCCALESNDFFIPDWSLPGVLDGAVERESSQHRHRVDCSALHVWLRLPVTVDFEFDAQCPHGPPSFSPMFTRHIQVQKPVTLHKCINNRARSYRRSYLASVKILGFYHTEAQSRWPQKFLQTHRSVSMSLPKPQLTDSWTPWQILKVVHTRSNFSWNCLSF